MPELGRRTAGRRVAELADQFSDDLLTDEDDAFAAADNVFATTLAGLSGTVEDAVRGADGIASLRNRQDLWAALTDAQYDAVTKTEPIAADLLNIAREKATGAILAELDVCERTLPARYRGLTADVDDNLTGYGGDLITALTDAYTTQTRLAVTTFTQDAQVQAATADTVDALLLRLFSPTPARLRGFGGRGVWWRTLTAAQANLRETAITCANTIRTEGIRMFNTLGESR